MSTSYKDLDIYIESFNLFIKVHKYSFKLPKYEMYELGSQLRRAADSINNNIVEGYGRKDCIRDFLKFLIYSRASNDQTINLLKKRFTLYPILKEAANPLLTDDEILGKKNYRFKQFVTKNWK